MRYEAPCRCLAACKVRAAEQAFLPTTMIRVIFYLIILSI